MTDTRSSHPPVEHTRIVQLLCHTLQAALPDLVVAMPAIADLAWALLAELQHPDDEE
jgi:hypothetical protein